MRAPRIRRATRPLASAFCLAAPFAIPDAASPTGTVVNVQN